MNAVKIVFELSPEVKNYGEAKTPADSLHEALCQAIHEDGDRSVEAVLWLNDNVLSVGLPLGTWGITDD